MNGSKSFKRLIKYFVLGILSLLVLISTGIITINNQSTVDEKNATFKLTSFDYLVNGTSESQYQSFLGKEDEIKSAFPVINIQTSLKFNNKEEKITLLFSDHMENFETGLLNEKTKISGNYSEDGLMLDKNAADSLGVKVGDTVTYKLMSISFEVKVSAIYVACTYKEMNNGLGVLKWTSVHNNAYKTNKKYSFTFIEANDLSKCEAFLRDFIPEYGIASFDEWKELESTKVNYTKTLLETDDEYNSRLQTGYQNYVTDKKIENKRTYQVQNKNDYLAESIDQTAYMSNTVKTAIKLVAIITPLVFVVLFVLFMLSEKNDNQVLSADGESMKKLLKINTMPSLVLAIAVVFMTAGTLFIYSLTKVFKFNYINIVLMFSIPTLIGTLIAYPIVYFNIKKYYDGVARKNNFTNLYVDDIKASNSYKLPNDVKLPRYDIVFTLRKFKEDILAAIISIFSIVVVLLIFASSFALSYSNATRFEGTKNTKIIFTTMTLSNTDSFKNYNGKLNVLANDIQLNVDVFATLEDVSYIDNAIGFKEELSSNECVISENIANASNIKIGSALKIRSTNIFYTVKGFIKSQTGIDNQYNHQGIVILKGDNSLDTVTTSISGNSYITFADEKIDTITSLDGTRAKPILYIEKLKTESRNELEKNVLFASLILLAFILVSEIFITKNKYRNQLFEVLDGIKPSMVTTKTVLSNIGCYILPGVIISVAYTFMVSSYGIELLIPSFITLIVVLIILIIYSCARINNEIKFINLIKKIGGKYEK